MLVLAALAVLFWCYCNRSCIHAPPTCQWNIVECSRYSWCTTNCMVFEANAAVTPAGNPVAVPIPVAPVVAALVYLLIQY
jgi:hypothetical protein